MFSNTILIATVSGTARNSPAVPHSHPQRSSESRMITGDRLRRSPSSLGVYHVADHKLRRRPCSRKRRDDRVPVRQELDQGKHTADERDRHRSDAWE